MIPHFAYNWQLNSDSTAGITIYGNGGMNTNYKASDTPSNAGTFGAGDTGVNLEQLFFNVNFTKKMNAKHAYGGRFIIAGQRFAAKGIDNFAALSLDPANLSGNRHSTSFGFGLKVGYQGEVAPGVRLGASYQSKIAMGEFDEYKGLFAEGGDFDIPSTYTLGISYEVGNKGIIVADIQRINYSDVAAISNPISNLTNGGCLDGLNNFLFFGGSGAQGASCLGGGDGGGFGWEDMTIIKLGYQFDVDDNTFRVGYSHADQPIPESETLFNILAPAVIEDHLTAGMTMRLPGNQEFNVAGMYALNNSVKGANPFDGGATQIEIEMDQWELQAGWAWKY